MELAIDQYNKELDENEYDECVEKQGEEKIKKIAQMFKLIEMEEEGMKFYTNFIM